MTTGIRVCAIALTCALVPSVLTTTPAQAKEGGGGNSCPWAQDVTLDLAGKTLTLPQSAFDDKSGDPVTIDGYQLYPEIDRLKLRIVSPKGTEWEAALTLLQGGKRCKAVYVGKAVAVSDGIGASSQVLVLNR